MRGEIEEAEHLVDKHKSKDTCCLHPFLRDSSSFSTIQYMLQSQDIVARASTHASSSEYGKRY
jgi:hypothetical protein